MTTIRMLLTIITASNCHLHKLDISSAFLHGDLHEEVYMEVPHRLTAHLGIPIWPQASQSKVLLKAVLFPYSMWLLSVHF